MDISKVRGKLEVIYKFLAKSFNIEMSLPFNYTKNEANEIIKDKLASSSPCMIARLGENESRTIVAYLNEQEKVKFNIKGSLRRESFSLDDKRIKNWMLNGAGFFPNTRKHFEKFSTLMLEYLQYVDLLASWQPREIRISQYLNKTSKTIDFSGLSPWDYSSPWSSTLENKNVLVIHPFETTIKQQYQKRKYLFKNPAVLPELNLITLKAVQSAAGVKPNFDTWFEALDFMCKKIDKIDFDIAIIGAGAYGFPLAAHIKRIGKKAIHLGGITQLLFGIKGKRWDNSEFAENFYNEYWIRPLPEDTPKQIDKVEGGTYW